jgi:hypothetical protein
MAFTLSIGTQVDRLRIRQEHYGCCLLVLTR